MKLLCFVLSFLLVAITALARPSVEVLIPQPSSQSPKITIVREGTPIKNAEVEVSTADGKPRASLSADEHGVVVLPVLPAGRYTIAARAPDHLQAYLLLDISKKKNKKPSEFSMQLFVGPVSFEEQIAAAEAGAPPDRAQSFNGTIVVPSGTAIPKIKIEIYERGSSAKKLLSSLFADAGGHFAVHLRDGAYTAVFQAQGFASKIYIFEVNADSAPKELRIRLDVGPVT